MTVEVKTKLTLDSNAARELANVKKGFRGTADAAKSAKSQAADFVKQVTSVAIGTALPGLIRGTYEMAKSWFTTAQNAYDSQQAVAGMVSLMQDVPWEEARAQAEGLHREMREMAIDVGQDFDDVNRALDMMVKTMGAGPEQLDMIRSRMEQLTKIANVSGEQASMLAREYSMAIEQGTLRMTGPLARMLGRVNAFGDDMRKGVTEFMKLDPTGRMEVMAAGLDSLSKMADQATPTFTDVMTSLSGTVDLLKESFGTPIVKALIPVVKDITDELKDMRPEIERFAVMMAQDFAEGARDAALWVKQSIIYVRDNWQTIKQDAADIWDGMKEAFVFAKDTVQWMIDNKELLAGALVGGKIGGAGGIAAGVGAGVAAAQYGEVGGAETAIGTAGAAGGAAAAAALMGASAAVTAALAAWAAAIYQGAQLYEEVWGERSEDYLNALAQMEHAEKAYAEGRFEDAKYWAKRARDMNDEGNQMSAKMLMAIHAREIAEQKLRHDLQQAIEETNLSQAIEVYNQAVLEGNTTMRQMAVEAIAASDELKGALDDSKLKVVGGMGSLSDAVINSSNELEDALRAAYQSIAAVDVSMAEFAGKPFWELEGKKETKKRKTRRRTAGRGGGGINVNKMEIKQEFRDQDPDRIAVVFRRDIVDAAVKRVQSRRATIFGI